MKKYSSGEALTHIGGTVRFRPDEPEDGELSRARPTPLKDVTVTLVSQSKEIHTTTDAAGEYSFWGLAPAKYVISAELAGYRLPWAPGEIVLGKNGCSERDLTMNVDRRVQGVVRHSDGEPVSGVLVEMMLTNRQIESWEHRRLMAVSEEDGGYVIDGIPPGDYYLGINIRSTPTKYCPYATTYYPNTTDIGQTVPIAIGVGAAHEKFDLRVSGKLPLVDIQGRILNADGKPPGAQDYSAVRITRMGAFEQIVEQLTEIDEEGRFHIELCEGFGYSAFAFSREGMYSAPVEFVPTKEKNRLELVLDKTQQEFLTLRDHAKD